MDSVEAAEQNNRKCLRGPKPFRIERNLGSTASKLKAQRQMYDRHPVLIAPVASAASGVLTTEVTLNSQLGMFF